MENNTFTMITIDKSLELVYTKYTSVQFAFTISINSYYHPPTHPKKKKKNHTLRNEVWFKIFEAQTLVEDTITFNFCSNLQNYNNFQM